MQSDICAERSQLDLRLASFYSWLWSEGENQSGPSRAVRLEDFRGSWLTARDWTYKYFSPVSLSAEVDRSISTA